ncbi:DUF2938 family protein [Antarctobacter sp.]|uniref:DUF2938 family protein n=1 Tax=Antarctobacter sp. TaxID=1872577 RepID=UPI003A92415C
MIVQGMAIGLIATLAINIWALLLFRVAGIPMPNRAMMGRWAAHGARGRLFHDSIAAAPPVPGETRIGWLFHICVGATFGVMLALLAGRDWLAEPTLLPALAFGIVTVGFGWFLMLPGMGLGIAGAQAPNPAKVRINGLLGHVVFGVALWIGALALA